jgi:CO/xanthine dehydrogenase Mo-binding subunit
LFVLQVSSHFQPADTSAWSATVPQLGFPQQASFASKGYTRHSSDVDIPEIVSTAVPSYEPRGPYGAKEVGEGSMVPVLGSIANAIYDAIGVRITELPITPERVLRALREKRDEA